MASVLQSSAGQVNDDLMELLVCISAAKLASARKVTAVLPLFPYSRQSEIPYHKTGTPPLKACESKPHTPHPDNPPSAGLSNGIEAVNKSLSKMHFDNSNGNSSSAHNARIANYGRTPPKRKPTMTVTNGNTSGHQGQDSSSTTTNGISNEEDPQTASPLAKVSSFQPRPGYKQWVAQSGTLVADLITCAGADHVITMDLHDPQYQGFLDIPVDNLYARPILKRYIEMSIPNYQQAIVVSPDAGGAKRASAIADGLGMPLGLIHRERRPTKITDRQTPTMMLVGDVANRTAIIVDDLADTATTLTRAAKLLKKEGAKTVYALITHGVFSGSAIDKINASPLDKVIVTNSVPQEANEKRCSKLVVLDVGHQFAEVNRHMSF
ncbi:ribose-phosphate pyrophosphokinase [Lecanora helva]